MRLLWSLPKAAPAIVRHLVAYAELAAEDLEQAHRDFKARIIASIVFGFSLFFLVLVVCLAVVALTWDTPHRLAAIAWLGGMFLFVTLVAGLYRFKIVGVGSRFLGSVRREWAEDRVVLDRILSDQD